MAGNKKALNKTPRKTKNAKINQTRKVTGKKTGSTEGKNR